MDKYKASIALLPRDGAWGYTLAISSETHTYCRSAGNGYSDVQAAYKAAAWEADTMIAALVAALYDVQQIDIIPMEDAA